MLSTDGIRTGAGGVVDEVEQRLVDVEDDELEVRAAALDGVRGGAELAVEGEGVVVEALHAARVAAAEQGDGRREAPHRRQRRHADPAGAQAVQALRFGARTSSAQPSAIVHHRTEIKGRNTTGFNLQCGS